MSPQSETFPKAPAEGWELTLLGTGKVLVVRTLRIRARGVLYPACVGGSRAEGLVARILAGHY